METERLIFRQYLESDRDGLVKLFTDPVVMKFVGEGVMTKKQAVDLWNKLTKKFYPQGKATIYGVFAKVDERYVGHASIRPRPEKNEDWEIGFFLCEAEWKKGFATEIARRLIEYGFSDLNLQEIFATVDDDHLASIHVLEKSGMKFLRHEFDNRGRFSVYMIRN